MHYKYYFSYWLNYLGIHFIKEAYILDNNKNREKDRPKSNAEKRKMYSEAGADIGIENGEKIGSDANGSKFTKRSKLSHNK